MTNWTERLLEAIDRLTSHGDSPHGPGHRLILTVDVDELERLAAEARAALAQPEPEGVTARELQWPPSVAQGCHEAAAEAEPGSPMQQLLVAAGDLLENYARPTIEPVPIAERLPGPKDCDSEGLLHLAENGLNALRNQVISSQDDYDAIFVALNRLASLGRSPIQPVPVSERLRVARQGDW
jgi:hypothetical protein